MISVFIRQSIIQLATPMNMRGRVSSVEFIFISASNELGEFESGVAARFLGPIGAVLMGGILALVTAAAWFKLFPQLARTDELEHVEEDSGDATGTGAGKPADPESKTAPRGAPFSCVLMARRSARRHHHDHQTAFELRLEFHFGDFGEVFLDPVHDVHAAVLVSHFSAAEAQGHLDLVARLEKARHRFVFTW